jgi:aminotransferase EvaB
MIPDMSKPGAVVTNFLPEQYRTTNKLAINHNYLAEQFADHDVILGKIREVVIRGDFTLGEEVDKLEAEFADLCNTRHAVSVGSGTDALFLSLKALGVREGDEVITTPFTFYATIGAIVTAGAKPVFVDVREDYNIDPDRIAAKITKKTKAVMPVHWAGRPCAMQEIEGVAAAHGIAVVSDACHAIKATYHGRQAGELGTVACFSFHPLKNLNVWGDGGIVATNSTEIANTLRLLRNHGLFNRDECRVFAYNSRLDTVQAVVARHLMGKIDHITQSRIANASYFDAALRGLSGIQVQRRDSRITEVFHLYQVLCDDRDRLQRFLVDHDVDAKVHYPIPMHLQPAAAFLGHKVGDFPSAESIARRTLSLPVHEFVTQAHQDLVISLIREFCGR